MLLCLQRFHEMSNKRHKLLTEKVRENAFLCIDPGLNNGPEIHSCLHRTCEKASVTDNVGNPTPPSFNRGGDPSHFSQNKRDRGIEVQGPGIESAR
jgi:hypothetical protein